MTDSSELEALKRRNTLLEEQNRLLRDQLHRRRSVYDRFFDAVARVLNRVFPGYKTKGLTAVGAAAVAWAAQYPEQAAMLASEYPVAAKVLTGAWFFLTWSSHEAAKRRPPNLPPPIPDLDGPNPRIAPKLEG